uniref:Uncharacterized protein n=1 Tax=Anguilla anguilla TaxID=7936 RepID=A0A0E9XC86_ANGAN
MELRTEEMQNQSLQRRGHPSLQRAHTLSDTHTHTHTHITQPSLIS